VWPGTSAYPDYLDNPATHSWLKAQLASWHAQVPWDGLWLDMNEASNFCSGTQCKPDTANETALYCEWCTVVCWAVS
jgi:alpha-glucosidase (family GH31 glycosyl hydrolase)